MVNYYSFQDPHEVRNYCNHNFTGKKLRLRGKIVKDTFVFFFDIRRMRVAEW